EVLRELTSMCKKDEGKAYNVYLSPEVARLLYEEEKASLEFIENTYKTKINIIANPEYSLDSFQVETIK
ncbi:MAG TPA: hypothetical protein P5124_06350, partial [Syntrophorhabdaceae bacterium]|nr:hypothetical protein [Syntrophorhabdaceae bacterium]